MEYKLKNCPCGHRAIMVGSKIDGYFVRCGKPSSCYIKVWITKVFKDPYYAWRAWNKWVTK